MFKLVVLFSVLALAVAKPNVVAYSAVPATSSLSQYSSSVVHGSPVVPAFYGASYSSVVPAVVLSQAPHSPAVVLDAVNGVPLDTPEVVAARAAHYQAKALSGFHHLAKRSAPLSYSSVVAPISPVVRSVVNPVAYSSPYVSSYPTSYVSTYSALPASYGYTAVVPKALSVHPW